MINQVKLIQEKEEIISKSFNFNLILTILLIILK